MYVLVYVSSSGRPPKIATTSAHSGAIQMMDMPLYARNIRSPRPRINPNTISPPLLYRIPEPGVWPGPRCASA